MRRVTVTALVLARLAAPAGDAWAQDAEAAVVAAIEQVFEGMRGADPAMVNAVFADDARFAMLRSRTGPPAVTVQKVNEWIGAIGESAGRWDEQIYDLDVRVDDDMASAWAPYTFYLDGEISHCGINSIELLRDAEGWKITQISDTRRNEDCPDPLAG